MDSHLKESTRIRVGATVVLLLCGAVSLGSIAYLVLQGYGNDNDTYSMLRAWQLMKIHGYYLPSRFQGAIVPEIVIGFSASLLGPIGSNLVSVILGTISLLLLYRLAIGIVGHEQAIWAPALVLANPYWILAMSTSMDHVYGTCLFLGGVALLVNGWRTFAMVLFAAATASRIAYGPMGLGALIAPLLLSARERQDREAWQAVLAYCFVCGLFYVPAFINARLTLDFLSAAPPQTDLVGRIARTLYKGANLMGVLATLVATGAVLATLRRHGPLLPHLAPQQRHVAILAALVIGYTLVLYFAIPADLSYLLPALFALALLLVLLRPGRGVLACILVLQLLHGFIFLDLLEIQHSSYGPCQHNVAVGAEVRPHLRTGVILTDLAGRDAYQSCLTEKYLIIQPNDPLAPLPDTPSELESK